MKQCHELYVRHINENASCTTSAGLWMQIMARGSACRWRVALWRVGACVYSLRQVRHDQLLMRRVRQKEQSWAQDLKTDNAMRFAASKWRVAITRFVELDADCIGQMMGTQCHMA